MICLLFYCILILAKHLVFLIQFRNFKFFNLNLFLITHIVILRLIILLSFIKGLILP